MSISGASQRRLIIAGAAIAALTAVWALAGIYGLPRLLRTVAVDSVQQRMHRKLELGEVHFNPFRLELRVTDVRLPDADGGPLLGAQQIVVNVELLRSLLLRGTALSVLQIDGLTARAILRKDGSLNLADLAQLAGPDDGDNTPARLKVERLAVTSGELDFRQLDRPAPFEARLLPIRFELQHFSTVDTLGNAYHFTARSGEGESLDWTGHLYLAPFRSSGEFRIGALRAVTVAEYLGDTLPFAVTAGTLNLTGRYDIDAGKEPLQLQAEVSQLDASALALRPRGAEQDYVQLAALQITGAKADVTQRHAQIGQIAIDGGRISAWLGPQGQFNLVELLGPASTVATPAPAATGTATATPWRYEVPDIAVRGLAIDIEDRSVEPHAQLAISETTLQIKGYGSDATKPLALDLALQVNGTGRLASQGELLLSDLSFKGQLALTDIDLTTLQPYLQRDTDMTLLSGRLSARLDLQQSAKAVLTARGDADIHQLRSIDNVLHQDFVKWQRLQARGIEYRSAPQKLRVHELIATEPYARIVVGNDRSLNITHVLNPPGRAAAVAEATGKAPAVVTGPAPDIAIDVVRVDKAAANFADYWIKPNFAVGLLDLSGRIEGLSSKADSRATVDLRGTVDRYAPATISGEINPLAAAVYSNLAMSFRNMDMTTVTPYSGHFAGYEIRKGKLSVELSYKIQDRKLDAGHHFVIDQLELGDRVESPDATSLPVRLAVAILKDRHGVIDVSLPVTGSLDDPQFRVAPLVWKAIVNLAVKAATAPFALLGSLFGGSDEQVNQLSFLTGTATLDAPSQQRLQSLRKALTERPGLELEVPAAWSAEQDRPALLRRELQMRLSAAAGRDRYAQLVEVWREEAGNSAPLPALAATFEADSKKPAGATAPADVVAELEASLLARLVVGDDELAELGKARAAAIQDALFADGGIDPTRVFVINAAPAAADAQLLRVDLTLK